MINYTNKFMNSKAAVNAVTEAVKRYTYPVLAVIFENNGLKPSDSSKILNSFSHHLPSLQSLNISQNRIGLEGAKCLAKIIPSMKGLKNLKLSDCNMGDKGIIMVLDALEACFDLGSLDLSGNQIGQSAYYGDCVTQFEL